MEGRRDHGEVPLVEQKPQGDAFLVADHLKAKSITDGLELFNKTLLAPR